MFFKKTWYFLFWDVKPKKRTQLDAQSDVTAFVSQAGYPGIQKLIFLELKNLLHAFKFCYFFSMNQVNFKLKMKVNNYSLINYYYQKEFFLSQHYLISRIPPVIVRFRIDFLLFNLNPGAPVLRNTGNVRCWQRLSFSTFKLNFERHRSDDDKEFFSKIADVVFWQ